MEKKEFIKVYIDIRDGRTVCVCHKNRKKCKKPCQEDVLERDKFYGWGKTMWRDKYGKSKF